MEEAVAQDAGVVDHAVDAAEGVERAFDDARAAARFRHAVVVGDRLAAGRDDLVDDALRRRVVAARRR